MSDGINKNFVYEKVYNLVENEGLILVDVEIKKSGDKTTLSLIIDKKGGVDIKDCEKISKIVDPFLDETDEIAGEYDYFTVSSAGLDRPFETTQDFLTHIGEKIEVKLYSSLNKKKFFTEILEEANDEFIVLNENIKILRNNIQKANIAIEF